MALGCAFLFLDESSYAPLDLSALTGVLVPLDKYVAVRDGMCQIVVGALAEVPDTIPQLIELHGNDLLSELGDLEPSEHDHRKLEVLRQSAALLNENRLQVFRVAYLNRSEIVQFLKLDRDLHGLNFLGIETALAETLSETLVVPIMDGIPRSSADAKAPRINPALIRAFAAHVRLIHHLRRYPFAGRSLSIENVTNLAEPVFGDSTHNVMLQLVDLVSWLLLQLDREKYAPSGETSDYKRQILRIAKEIDPALVHADYGKLRLPPMNEPWGP
jgi:Protein of unknown function (DUF3800)